MNLLILIGTILLVMGRKGKFNNLTFEEKKNNLLELIRKCKSKGLRFIFFNAWNEWSESAYLEPDKKNGYKHLEIIKDILKKVNE